MRRFVGMGLAALALLPGTAAQATGPFATPPGNLERATAGVAVAGRGSIASVWHNPATLVDAPTSIAAGWAKAPERGESGRLTGDENTLFAGAAFVNERKRYGKAAIGITAYTPHSMTLSVARSGQANSAFGRVDWTSQAIGVPYAIELEDYDLSLGVTGELIGVDPGGSNLQVEGELGQVNDAQIDYDQGVGLSGALGLRYGGWESGVWDVDVAARLRLPATSGTDVEASAPEAEVLLPDKPHGYALGARASRQTGDQTEWAGQVQLGQRHWGDSATVTHWGLGFEWAAPFASVAFFDAGTRRVHAGFSRWSVDEEERWMDWPEGHTVGAGVAFVFDSGQRVDLSLQHRREDRDAFGSSSALFIGLSGSVSY